MRQHLRNAVLIAAITALGFLAIEMGVRVFAPQTVRTDYLQGGPLGQEDSVLGHVNTPLTHARVSAPEFVVEYYTDENGRRAHPGARAGANGTAGEGAGDNGDSDPTILLIGDSFTYGAASDYADIWPVLLSERLAEEGVPARIVNAGVPGYNTAQQALMIERLHEEIRPDIVVMMFLPNDLFSNVPIQSEGGTEIAERDAGAVVAGAGKRSTLHTTTLMKRMMMENDALYQSLYLMTPRREFFGTGASELYETRLETTRALLTRTAGFLEERETDFVVISVPQLFQVLYAAAGTEREDVNVHRPDEALSQLAEDQGFDWVATLDPLAEAYAASGEDLFFRYDGHLNARGNEVMAALVHDALRPLLER